MATFKQYKDKKTGVKKWEWRGYVCTDPNTGKKVVSAHKGFNTKRDAVKDFEDTKRKINEDDFTKSDLTFEELFNEFIEYKRDRIKPTTIITYEAAYKAILQSECINPNKKIASVNKVYCNGVYKALASRYTGNTLNSYFKTLVTLFNYAMKEGYINQNPFNMVDKSKRYDEIEEKRVNSLDKEDLIKLLNVAQSDNKLYFTLFRLLAYTGMRQGEARALKWSDIDFKENTISITKTITKGEQGNYVIGKTPKTKSSHRVIKMDNETASILKQHRDEWREYYSKRGKLFKFNDAVIFQNDREERVSCSTVCRVMKRYCKAANVPTITPHGLRHTYVSLMIEAGIQPIEIAHNVGHSNLKMIMGVYDEMTKNRKEKTADIFAQFMAK